MVVDGRAQLRVQAHVDAPGAQRAVWLLPALLRPAAMEPVIRMATELGVVRITPIRAERVVAKGDKSARWQRIAQAASAQCGRADLPQIDPPCTLAAGLEAVSGPWRLQMCVPGDAGWDVADGPVALFIGPEGGWTPEELGEAEAAGATAMGLGQTVLRADTAAAVALARVLA